MKERMGDDEENKIAGLRIQFWFLKHRNVNALKPLDDLELKGVTYLRNMSHESFNLGK
jgi:hypothetical protein